jgi:membrane fusion protein
MFRSEVEGYQASRIEGAAFIAIPVSWTAVALFFAAVLVVVTGFLATASYARVETVTGVIEPDKGVATITPTRSGVLTALAQNEGASVAKGELLVEIRTEEDGAGALAPAQQVRQAIASQDANLASQIEALQAAASAQLGQLATQQSGLRLELEQIRSQIGLQEGLIKTAQTDLDRSREVAKRGFLSARDLQVREETLLVRQQALSQLRQSLSVKLSSRAELERTAAQVSAQSRAQVASLTAARAQVEQQAASSAGAGAYAIRAPMAGTVTAVTAREGQTVSPATPLMAIIPDGAQLQAVLSVPSAAIGFVKVGQEVRIGVDAFPYERFGTVVGRVLSVAESPLNIRDADGSALSSYPVRVRLERKSVEAFGRKEPLIPGMTLTARIVTERQSLLEWLFEPLFAVRRR